MYTYILVYIDINIHMHVYTHIFMYIFMYIYVNIVFISNPNIKNSNSKRRAIGFSCLADTYVYIRIHIYT
jgi:hypothetical protein